MGAAYRAARAGHAVTLIERSGRLGGAAASHTVGGVRVDLGSHRLHPSIDPAILAELDVLMGGDLQRRTRNGRIRLEGRWIAFPLRPGDLLRRMPPAMALAVARDLACAPLRRPRADTFDEVLRAALGPAICRRFYLPYSRKIWGVPPAELAGEQARRRVSASTPGRILRRALSRGDAGRRTFLYPRRGYGQIVEALAGAAEDAGARILRGTAVTRLDLAPDGAAVTLADGRRLSGRRVWSTIPLTALAAMTRPAPDRAALAAARALRFRAMLLVYLVLDVPRYTAYDAHYLPGRRDSRDPDLGAAQLPRRGRPARRHGAVRGDPVRRGRRTLGRRRRDPGGLVTDALAECGLPSPPVGAVEVARLPQAYPVMRAGFEAHLARLEAWADAQPALLTLGRQGLFVHDNAHHALAMAWAAADCLGPDGGFDAAGWASARRRFAGHVVED